MLQTEQEEEEEVLVPAEVETAEKKEIKKAIR